MSTTAQKRREVGRVPPTVDIEQPVRDVLLAEPMDNHGHLRAGTARLAVHMARELQDRTSEACRMVAQERRHLRPGDYKAIERAIKAAEGCLRFLHRLQAMTLAHYSVAPGDPGLEAGSDEHRERALRTGA